MITVGNQQSNLIPNNEQGINDLDTLVESICESYHIPASILPGMKSGLENALYEFLSKFISDNHLEMTESAEVIIPVDGMLEDPHSAIDSILESARFNGTVSLTHKGEPILNVVNISESITYQLGKIDVDKINPDSLLEAWKCNELEQLRPLLKDVLDYCRKES